MRAITFVHEVSDTFLGDVLTTALEGGIGYWCLVNAITRDDKTRNIITADGAVDAETLKAFDAEQFAEGFDARLNVLTWDTVARGIQRAIDPALQALPSHARPHADYIGAIVNAALRDDASDIDANEADIIIQLGLFGQVIYG